MLWIQSYRCNGHANAFHIDKQLKISKYFTHQFEPFNRWHYDTYLTHLNVIKFNLYVLFDVVLMNAAFVEAIPIPILVHNHFVIWFIGEWDFGCFILPIRKMEFSFSILFLGFLILFQNRNLHTEVTLIIVQKKASTNLTKGRCCKNRRKAAKNWRKRKEKREKWLK